MRRRRKGAGRPRKAGLKRYANGRIIQGQDKCTAEYEMSQREALSVGLSARMRHHGLTRAEAKSAAMGYLLGRLLEVGRGERRRAPAQSCNGISRRQHDAAHHFALLRAAYGRVCQSPKAPSAIDLTRVNVSGGGDDSDDSHAGYENRIRRQFHAALAVIARADAHGLAALEDALDDKPLTRPALAALRTALNALLPAFGL